MRYLKSAFSTLKKQSTKFLVVMAAVIFVFSAVGYAKTRKDAVSDKEKQNKIDAYLAQVESCENAVAESEKAYALAKEQMEASKAYVENAVYMKLDSDNTWVGSVQYTIQPGEGTNVGSILHALNYYVTQGGLREDIGEF